MRKRMAAILLILSVLMATILQPVSATGFNPEEKETYNMASQVFSEVNGNKGITFKAQPDGGEVVECDYYLGQWDSTNMVYDPTPGENGDEVSAMYWPNDPKGANAYMFLDTFGGDMLIEYISPVDGKVSFNFEAALVVHEEVADEDGILLSVTRADGTKLMEDLDITVQGKQEWGEYKMSSTNAYGSCSFEVAEGETITLRFDNKTNGTNDHSVVWWSIRYSRIGQIVSESPTTEAPTTPAGTSAPADNTDSDTAAAPATSGDRDATESIGGEEEPASPSIGLMIGIAAAVVVVAVVIFVVVRKKKK